ncbi:MAG: exopolysaccharide biosynthesis protein [Rhodobacteraceae bacterium]|nr:MAG: exopolysaccharide biosynthesis protein [Paracoccaceae bacterium]
MSPPRTLGEILQAIDPDPGEMRAVSVADVLGEIGERSFAPMVLVVSVLLVSPLSAIPGAPSIGGILVTLIASQWLAGRRHLWLPGVILRRAVSARRLSRAIGWLKPWAAWFDRNSKDRLTFLTLPPLTFVAKAMIVVIAATWPLLEILPMVTSVGALAVSLLAFGLMVRDGLWLAAGYATVGGSAALVFWLAAEVRS